MDQHISFSGTSLALDYAYRSDIGLVRSKNEDAVGAFKHGDGQELLLVVADGVGGGPGGEVASDLALNTLFRSYGQRSPGIPKASLRAAFEDANARIIEKAASDLDLNGMGTTCTAVLMTGTQFYCAHIGDSRAYLLRGESHEQLTVDHLIRLKPAGEAENAARPSGSAMLSRCLGASRNIEVDITGPLSIESGDGLLLCSDGLYRVVEDEEIAELARNHSPEKACDMLISLALERGGPDNITVLIGRKGEAVL